MKRTTTLLCLTAISAGCPYHGAFGNIEFQFGSTYLEAIHIKESMDFTVTTGGSDASFGLVMKDAYLTDTRYDDSNPSSDAQIFSNSAAILNGNIISDASHFITLGENAPPLPGGIDIDATDLILRFVFTAYDPVSSPWSLSTGDTITIESGSILSLSGEDIPNPDNLSSSIVTQIFGENSLTAFSDDQTLAIVPEKSMCALSLGLLAFACTALKRRHRTSLSGLERDQSGI